AVGIDVREHPSLAVARVDDPGAILLVDRDDDHHHKGNHGHGHGHGDHGWGPRPGWNSSWRYERSYHPRWWGPKIAFPSFVWLNVNPGVWQCTAFNQYDQYIAPSTYVARTQSEAAYGALYDCGGPDYQASGCFIPDGYCRRR